MKYVHPELLFIMLYLKGVIYTVATTMNTVHGYMPISMQEFSYVDYFEN